MEKKVITSIVIIIIIALGGIFSLGYFYKTKSTDLSVYVIEGDTWGEIGEDYGRKCKSQIQGLVSLLREIGDATDLFKTSFEELQAGFEPYIPQYLIDEMKGLAKGAEVDYIDILMINCFAEIMYMVPGGSIGCTQFAKINKVGTAGPVFGRNLDFFPSFFLQNFNAYLVISIGGTKMIGETIAGMVGFLSGMNEAGLVVSISVMTTDEMGFGFPMVLAIRNALQQYDTVAEAEAFLSAQTHTLGWNFFLLDKNRDAAVVEATHLHHHTRWLNDAEEVSSDYMAATNNFHSEEMYPYCHGSENSERRKARAEQLMEQNDNFGLGDAIQILKDDYDASIDATNPGRNSIDRKWLRKTFLPAGTLGSFLALPEAGYCVVTNGYPDSALFYAVNFQGEVTGPIA